MNNCIFCNNILYKKHILDLFNENSVYYCPKCNLAFTFPFPHTTSYEELDFHLCTKMDEDGYDTLTDFNDLPDDWRRLIEVQTSIINRNLPPHARILEIGCGEGILLTELQKNGFYVFGIEPSTSAYGRAKKRNLDIIKGAFPDVEIKTKFDLVIMSQVLEHIKDLNHFIDELKKIIPSGYLLLTQTNFKGLIPLVQKEKWYGWVPEQHFWHFTLEGLKKLLIKHDFEIIDYKYSSLSHPHNLLYKLALLKENWQDQFTALFKMKQY